MNNKIKIASSSKKELLYIVIFLTFFSLFIEIIKNFL